MGPTEPIELWLPWPPSVNHYWGSRVVSQPGRKPFVSMYIMTSGVEYRARVAECVRRRLPGHVTIRDPVRWDGVVFRPTRAKHDLSNLLKALEDSLTACGFYEDDSLIVCQTQVLDPRIVVGGAYRLRITPFGQRAIYWNVPKVKRQSLAKRLEFKE